MPTGAVLAGIDAVATGASFLAGISVLARVAWGFTAAVATDAEAAGRICSGSCSGTILLARAGATDAIDAEADAAGFFDVRTTEWRGIGTWASWALERRMFFWEAAAVVAGVEAVWAWTWLGGMHCLRGNKSEIVGGGQQQCEWQGSIHGGRCLCRCGRGLGLDLPKGDALPDS